MPTMPTELIASVVGRPLGSLRIRNRVGGQRQSTLGDRPRAALSVMGRHIVPALPEDAQLD